MFQRVRQGKYLEHTAVKSDEVLLNQLVPGLDVVIEAHPQKRADLVVAVVGKSMPIGDENKEEIEQEFVVGKRAEEAGSEKPMLYVGEASLNGAEPLWDKRLPSDHDFSPPRTGG
jgi:hypothetical protein